MYRVYTMLNSNLQASRLLLKNLLRIKDSRQSTIRIILRSKANLNISKSESNMVI